MFYVEVYHGVSEFAYNYAQAVMQAYSLCELYGKRVAVRAVGQDEPTWTCFPKRSLVEA